MKQKTKLTTILISFSLILILTNIVEAVPPTLNLTTTKTSYSLGEIITLTGNLTADGTPATDALVTIQILNPRSETIALRSVTTGTNSSSYIFMEILEFYPCDSYGNPKYSFKRGGDAGFKIRVRNNAASPYTIIIPIYIQYSNDIPFKILHIYEGTIDPNQVLTVSTWPIPIPSDAPLGTTKAYANIISKYPKDGGRAYALEKSTTFQITTSSTSSTASESFATQTTASGTFNITFSTNPYGGILGNYTAYATSFYYPYLLTAQTTFPVILKGDITGPYGVPDGKVDIKDVAKVSKAFGQSPPSDPKCDLNKDGKVDIKDVAIVSLDFGKYGTLP
jgi:hypothetical protein